VLKRSLTGKKVVVKLVVKREAKRKSLKIGGNTALIFQNVPGWDYWGLCDPKAMCPLNHRQKGGGGRRRKGVFFETC